MRRITAIKSLKKQIKSTDSSLNCAKGSLNITTKERLRASWKRRKKYMTRQCQRLTSHCSRRHSRSTLKLARQFLSASMKVENRWSQIIRSSWPSSKKPYGTSSSNNRRSFMEYQSLTLKNIWLSRQTRVISLEMTARWGQMNVSTKFGLHNASMNLSIHDLTTLKSSMMLHLRSQTSAEQIGPNSIHHIVQCASQSWRNLAQGKIWTTAIEALGQSLSFNCQKATGLSS